MTNRDIISALIVVLVWGLNFIAMKVALVDVPPFLFLVLRILFTVLPLILFLPRPNISLNWMLKISFFQWILNFAFLFTGMYMGLSAGVSALIIQSQVIFTIVLSCIYYKSKPSLLQIVGLTVSFSGLILLTTHGDCSANIMGILLLCGSALSLSISNILYKSLPKDVHMPSLIVWSSLVALPQAMILLFITEGWADSFVALASISWSSVASIAYTVFISTMIGVVTWGRLMQSSDPIRIVPFTLLIPVVAMTSGYLMLGEEITWFDVTASVIIISGLLVNQLSSLKRAKVVKLETTHKKPLKKAA